MVAAAISYAIGLDGVASVLIGCRSPAEVAEAVSVVSDPVDRSVLDALVERRVRIGGRALALRRQVTGSSLDPPLRAGRMAGTPMVRLAADRR